jgi:hypothetical protein
MWKLFFWKLLDLMMKYISLSPEPIKLKSAKRLLFDNLTIVSVILERSEGSGGGEIYSELVTRNVKPITYNL